MTKLYENARDALAAAKKEWKSANGTQVPTDFGYNKFKDIDTHQEYHEFIFSDETITDDATNWDEDALSVERIYKCGFSNDDINNLYNYEDSWIVSVEDMGDGEFRKTKAA